MKILDCCLVSLFIDNVIRTAHVCGFIHLIIAVVTQFVIRIDSIEFLSLIEKTVGK